MPHAKPQPEHAAGQAARRPHAQAARDSHSAPQGLSEPAAHERAALARALSEHGVQVPEGPAAAATALLPVLHHIQDALGFVPAALVPHIAQAFNRSRAEVHGVITYYAHFRSAPPGRQVLQLCQAEACRALGAAALMAEAEAALACAAGHTRADGAVTLEAAYCLGLCAAAPAGVWNGQLHARVSTAHLHEWVQRAGPCRPASEKGLA